MKVVIIGAGFTGVELAKVLVAEGNDVVLIDKDAEKVRRSRDRIDCAVVQSSGNSLRVLEEDAGIQSADALVALTDDDEINMVTCSLVDSAYPHILKIARVRNEDYYAGGAAAPQDGNARPPFGIDVMIQPDTAAAAAICRVMSHGSVGNMIEIGSDFGIVSLPVADSGPLAGVKLEDLPSVDGWRGLVAFVESGGGAFLPCGGTRLSAGDRIGVLVSSSDLPGLLKLTTGAEDGTPPRKVVVSGAGRIGSLVVERLLAERPRTSFLGQIFRRASNGGSLILVDGSEPLCRAAAERFGSVRTLCGDITDPDLVRDEGLDDCDLMIAASGNYERNLIAAAYLKSRGAGKTIALTESSDFNDVASKLGVDVAVSMRGMAVDAIMSHLRGPGVTSIHTVCNRLFEIVECDVPDGGKACGKALRDLPIRGECLVLLIRRSGECAFAVPNGDTEIRKGDHIVFIMRSGDIRTVRMFAGKA